MAGWQHVGHTKSGLWVYQQFPADMPPPEPIPGTPAPLFDLDTQGAAA